MSLQLGMTTTNLKTIQLRIVRVCGQTKYFSRRDKSAKSTYFREIRRFWIILYMERREISTELMRREDLDIIYIDDEEMQEIPVFIGRQEWTFSA